MGNGTEEDPRDYIMFLQQVFETLLSKLKPHGIVWLNMGDAYNTPINWGYRDYKYSTLGIDLKGFKPDNAAYTKPRFKRRAFIDKAAGWLQYGNLLMLPQRLLIALTDLGYLYRGEVIWDKKNAMPEGRCRRPHRKHEPIYLLARDEQHFFRATPPVPSVWRFANEHIPGLQHRSRFPVELPLRCIEAYGRTGKDVVVLDPFSGSGSTGLAAVQLGCTYVGFEIDPQQAVESKSRLSKAEQQTTLQINKTDADLKSPTGIERTGRLDL